MNETDQSHYDHLERMLESHSGSTKLWKFFSIVMGGAYAAFLIFESGNFSSGQVGVISACCVVSLIIFVSQWQRESGAIDRIKQEMKDLSG
uniref:hypothetical protein n=1 Tax=Rheinheimera sp. TaxID=1869214 RepID=UPI0040487169